MEFIGYIGRKKKKSQILEISGQCTGVRDYLN